MKLSKSTDPQPHILAGTFFVRVSCRVGFLHFHRGEIQVLQTEYKVGGVLTNTLSSDHISLLGAVWDCFQCCDS